MLDKEPSGAAGKTEAAPTPLGPPPGGPFPPARTPDGSATASAASHQFTLQYLIAALKKSANKE